VTSDREVVLVGPDPGEEIDRLLADPEIHALLSAGGEIRVSRHAAGTPGFTEELRAADRLFLTGFLPTGALAGSERLKVISVTATGYRLYLDVEEAHGLGIDVAYVPSYGDEAVAEHALALVLALAKNLPTSDASMRAGRWISPPSLQLAGATAGVVGLGGVGRRMVGLLEGLGMDVLVWTRSADPARLAGTRARYVPLPDLVENVDVLTLHLAHTRETEGLLDAELLGRARPGLVLVNTARAEIIAPGALEEHVSSGRIRAGVDVFRSEPPAADDPVLALGDGVIMTPHVAFNTPQASRAMFVGAARNIATYGTEETCHLAPRSS
jgi:D-3-phosphoglycerate dehydrogenase / 2-oxoglutarate reductase